MADGSKIEWTDATWNVVIGCDKVSPGCDHCYAIRTAHRFQEHPNPTVAAAYAGTEADGDWTGRVNLVESRLDLPLRWKRPRRIFVNAQSDLFHGRVTLDFLAKVWAVMSLTPQHTYQILTKRAGIMRSILAGTVSPGPGIRMPFKSVVDAERLRMGYPVLPDSAREDGTYAWPLPNVWLGVSVEDQARLTLRVPALLDTPAAVRWLSCEPLLGPVDVINGLGDSWLTGIDWIVAGGESGPGSRPMHPDWVRSLRDQCDVAGVPFLFKQWGSHRPSDVGTIVRDGVRYPMVPSGKRAAGRALDGRTWDEYPQEVPS